MGPHADCALPIARMHPCCFWLWTCPHSRATTMCRGVPSSTHSLSWGCPCFRRNLRPYSHVLWFFETFNFKCHSTAPHFPRRALLFLCRSSGLERRRCFSPRPFCFLCLCTSRQLTQRSLLAVAQPLFSGCCLIHRATCRPREVASPAFSLFTGSLLSCCFAALPFFLCTRPQLSIRP
jgi:hypothetical protein